MKREADSYPFVLKFIHWTTALLILGLLFVGFTMTAMPFSDDKLKLYMLHKSFGLLVLALVFVRVAAKLLTPKVKPLDTHKPWETFLAKITHIFLYFALFALPISGWIMSSAGEFPVSFFGLPVPSLMPKNHDVFESSRDFHEFLALAVLVLVFLHMAGAAKHHVIDRDLTMMRMMNSKNYNFLGAFAVLVLLGFVWLASAALVALDLADDKGLSEQAERVDDKADDHEDTAKKLDSDAWAIVADQSRLAFEAVQYGQPFKGDFAFDGRIVFDPDHLDRSLADISIDIGSIKTGSDDRDAQAVSAEWFDAKAFPKARFVAEKFESTGANQFAAHGQLTIRDVTLPVSFPFTLTIEKKEHGERMAQMNAELTLNRLDFGVGSGQWKSTEAIGDAVKISISVQAVRAKD